jgi:mono/diheme cytochrome c family protein
MRHARPAGPAHTSTRGRRASGLAWRTLAIRPTRAPQPLPAPSVAGSVSRTLRSARAIGAAVVLLALAWHAPAPAADDLARGQALYETRCGACHERSVHRRESRVARDFAGLRAEVARWSATAGSEWRPEEIDLVAAYLNERYYKFPCPPTVCRAPTRAAAAPPGS